MSRELWLRWLSAVLLVPPVLWACYAGGALYLALVTGFAVIGVLEFHGLLRAKGVEPQRALGIAGAVLLPCSAGLVDPALSVGVITALLVGSLVQQLCSGRHEGAIATVGGSFLGTLYVGGGLAYAVGLRAIADDPRLAAAALEPRTGFFFAVFALAAAVGSDAGGFFAGRRFGRHKLAPRISPGKTVEGAVGAIATGIGFGLAVLAVFRTSAPQLTGGWSWIGAAAAAGTLAGVAIVGDLIESLLKRDAALKDAGHIVPGVGGVLDRIDSVLLALPVMYYWVLGRHAWF